MDLAVGHVSKSGCGDREAWPGVWRRLLLGYLAMKMPVRIMDDSWGGCRELGVHGLR